MMRATQSKPKAPGKAYRDGVSLMQLFDMFPDEEAATEWFERTLWDGERCCGHCGSVKTRETPNRMPMPYWCSDCRKYFSVRTGTPLAHSNVKLRKWVVAVYLELTSLKSISSMKLSRDINVTQKTAWFMLQRIREAWNRSGDNGQSFTGPVEVDEAYFGGKRRNMSNKKRRALAGTGRGTVGKTAVAGMKDRESNQVQATLVRNTKSETMCRFIIELTDPETTMIYTDDALTYYVLPKHETVKHSVSQYVKGQAHTNGVESFRALLKRAYQGTFHKLSPKHLGRYVREFAGKHNLREFGTLDQMRLLVRSLAGKRLSYRDLIRDSGLSSGARS